MSIQLEEEDGGKILAVHVSGKLVKADYERFLACIGKKSSSLEKAG